MGQLPVAGEYGCMALAAQHWAEAGALLCECLAAELAAVRSAAGSGAVEADSVAAAACRASPDTAETGGAGALGMSSALPTT